MLAFIPNMDDRGCGISTSDMHMQVLEYIEKVAARPYSTLITSC